MPASSVTVVNDKPSLTLQTGDNVGLSEAYPITLRHSTTSEPHDVYVMSTSLHRIVVPMGRRAPEVKCSFLYFVICICK